MSDTTTYDASKYAQRGDGMQDWIKAGKPPYDVAGRELDPAGWPTGNMKDGSSTDTGNAPPANTNLVGGESWVTLQTVDSIVEVPFIIPTAGAYWLAASEQPDQNWTLAIGDVSVTGNGSSDEAAPFQLPEGGGVLTCSFNSAAASPAQLAEREAAGQGVSKMHYTLRAA